MTELGPTTEVDLATQAWREGYPDVKTFLDHRPDLVSQPIVDTLLAAEDEVSSNKEAK